MKKNIQIVNYYKDYLFRELSQLYFYSWKNEFKQEQLNKYYNEFYKESSKNTPTSKRIVGGGSSQGNKRHYKLE